MQIIPNSSIQEFSDEILIEIFRYLKFPDLISASETCRKWYKLSWDHTLWEKLDLSSFFNGKLTVVDWAFWKVHIDVQAAGLSVEDVPPPNKREIIAKIKQFLSLKQEEDAGATLIQVPLNATLNHVKAVARNGSDFPISDFSSYSPEVSKLCGDTPVRQTYWALLTDSILEGTRNVSVKEQEKVVHDAGCSPPDPLTAAAHIVSLMKKRGETFYRSDSSPPTATLCTGMMNNRLHKFVVGWFSKRSRALCVTRSTLVNGDRHIGMGAMRKI